VVKATPIFGFVLASLLMAGPGHSAEASDLPEGIFRSQWELLPTNVQTQVLDSLSLLEVPDEDFNSLRIHPLGKLFYVCDMGGLPMRSGTAETASANEAVPAGVVPIDTPPVFHSRPGSTNILFLDFNGHVVTNTAWNSYPDFATPSWDCRPYAIDADDTTFSVAEQLAMQVIWERVAEDYAPFDIDVTTEQPAAWNRRTGHVLITPEIDKNGNECPHFNAGGIAFVDVFGDEDYSYDYAGECLSPAWVLNYEVAGYAEYEAEASAHEMGHNLELSHDGTKTSAYYGGHENGSIGWGPIMGAAYGRDVSQWSKGDYRLSNNAEDDLAILASQISYRADDFGNDHGAAAALAVGATGAVFQAGVIGMDLDLDVFQFTASSGMVQVSVSPYRDAVSTTWGGNLDVVLELYDSSGTLMATNNPELETTASLSVLVSNGVYYLHIKPTGVGDPFLAPFPSGYVQYGSLGQYTIAGTVSVNLDVDEDGLPNDWEVAYFGAETNALPHADADGDGADNLTEYISGHNPTNPGSVFKATAFMAPSTSGVPAVITWDSIENRIYHVDWSDDLVYTPLTNNISGDQPYPANSYTDSVERTSGQNYYRVDVRLEQ
jgi:hypothetical protein